MNFKHRLLKKLYLYVTLLFLLVFKSSKVFSQTKISGIVIDEYTSLPIENVKIKVKDLNMGAISDQKGFFTITLNKEFPITLISSNLGYDNLNNLNLTEGLYLCSIEVNGRNITKRLMIK